MWRLCMRPLIVSIVLDAASCAVRLGGMGASAPSQVQTLSNWRGHGRP